MCENMNLDVRIIYHLLFSPFPRPPFFISFHFIFEGAMEKAGLKQTVDMCGSKNALTHTWTHINTHIYTHVYGERAVFFRREARLSLSHSISSWSYIRGQREHTDIPARRRCQDQKSDWLLYAAGEKDREEEKRGREQRRERIYAGYGCIFLNILSVETQKALHALLQQILQFSANKGPIHRLIHCHVFPPTPVMLCVFTVLRAIVAIVTYCSLAARLMGNHAPCCLHLVPCFSY